jgi:hypothetical protein
MKSKFLRRAAAGLTAGAAVGAGGLVLLRQWQRFWRATDEEIARAMPLDDRVPDPTYVTNRALTIQAPPEDVWPWLAQMGELPRGGFYSYLTVERLLRMKVENADRILPEFQNPKVGEAIDRAGTLLVLAVEPRRHLVLGPPRTLELQSTWALALYPAGHLATRLVSRCRARLPRGAKGLLWSLILDPGQFVMERKMLLEIKRRVESRAAKRFGFAPAASRAS